MQKFLSHYLNRIRLFCRTHARLGKIIVPTLLSAGLVCIVFVMPVHAAGDSSLASAVADKLLELLTKLLLLIAQLFQKFTLFEVDLLQVFASYNGYLNSTAVNVGWVVVRDVSNMAFVVILLVIAFATILGWEAYEWKKLLPKMVMAAVLINFSRTICGVLIDASQVVIMTFLNAISATVSGNVIQSFYFANFSKFHPSVAADTGNSLANFATSGIFVASVAAAFFSALVCIMLAFYVGILLARVVRLWVLIVLSPMAFVFSILPATQGYAKQWWDELMDDLVTGPVILFFLWLAFVVVGSGQVNQELLGGSDLPHKDDLAKEFQTQSVGVSDALGWNYLANLVIGIGILFVGVRVSGQIGGTSGSIMSSALNFGKRVATIASGYAAGRWLYDKGVGTVKGAAAGVYNATVGTMVDRGVRVAKSQLSTAYRLLPVVGTVARNLKAKEWKSRGGAFNAVRSWVWESGGRRDKRVQDYETMAEKALEIEDRTYGTSKEGAGPKKQQYSERARQLESQDEAKKQEKMAEERERQEGKVRDLLELQRNGKTAEFQAGYNKLSSLDKLYFDTYGGTIASRIKGGKLSHMLGAQEKEAEAGAAKASLSDHELHAYDEEAHRAEAAAHMLEEQHEAVEKLGKVQATQRVRELAGESEAERIRKEEEAKALEEDLHAEEEKQRAEIQQQVLSAPERQAALELASQQRAETEIIRQSIEARKKQIDAIKKQAARQGMDGDLKKAAELTAQVSALTNKISADQQLLEARAEKRFALGEGTQEGIGAETLQQTREAKDEAQRIKGLVAAEDELHTVEEQERGNKNYEEIGQKTLEAKARAEEIRTHINEDTELAVAKARDTVLISQNKQPIHEQSIRQRQFKAKEDLLRTIAWDRMMANIGTLSDEAKGLAAIKPEDRSQDQKDKYNNIIKELSTIAVHAAAQGGEYTTFATERMVQDLGIDHTIDMSDPAKAIVAQQAKKLSGILGRAVKAEKTEVEHALNELAQVHGEGFNAFMERWATNLDNSAGEGAVNNAGLFRAKYDKDKARMEYHAVNLSGGKNSTNEELREDFEHYQNKRNEAFAKAKANNLTTFLDSVDRDKKGNIRIESKEALDFMAKAFGNVSGNMIHMINQKAINDLNQAFKNMGSKEKINKVIEAMLSKSAKPDAVLSLLKQLDSLKGKIPEKIGGSKNQEKVKIEVTEDIKIT
jgi:hypothetical protein